MVVLAPVTDMPADVKAMAEATVRAIATGRTHPSAGPVTKQDWRVAIEAGETGPDPMILGMHWSVTGIDDTLPR